jgi:hypothetical protein
MREETREMTLEMKEAYKITQKMEAYADACKSKVFIKTKTIAEAILASSIAYQDLWKIVTNTWPETKSATATLRRDLTIKFEFKD